MSSHQAQQTINIYFDPDEIERFDRLARSLSFKAHGAKVTRSAAIKVLVKRGWERMEELGETTTEGEK